MMIMFSGAGHMKRMRSPERSIKRDCRPVGADYEPDIIEYREGYWSQYGVGTVVLWSICLGLITLCIVQPAFFQVFIWVPIIAIPFSLLLPMWWIRTYRRQLAIFEGLELSDEKSSVEEIMA